MKVCLNCNDLFKPLGARKYCSKECSKKGYATRAREFRRMNYVPNSASAERLREYMREYKRKKRAAGPEFLERRREYEKMKRDTDPGWTVKQRARERKCRLRQKTILRAVDRLGYIPEEMMK